MSALILAIDIGTSSSRTALFDENGQRIVDSTAQRSYPLHTTTDGGAELAPEHLLEAIRLCLRETLSFAKNSPVLSGRRIAGIGVSCFWHSLVGLDKNGRTLTPIITWADSRCRPEAAKLREDFSEKAVHARTGCMLRPSFWPAKLLWMRSRDASLFSRVHKWMSPAEWLQLELTGSCHCSLAMASGTGLFNPTALTWDQELLTHCGITSEHLPSLTDAPVTFPSQRALEFPELGGVPWFPAIGDGAASNLGSGCTQPGLAAINVGTSAALRIMRTGKRATAPFGLFCYRVDARRFLVGGAVSNAGNLRAWCLEQLNTGTPGNLEDQLAARPLPDHGLTVLPFWTAERSPTWDEDLRGCIYGITQSTTGIDLLQAITEATYHRLALIADLLCIKARVNPKFLVSGGIQKSQSALQRLANVLNRSVHPNPEPEASIRGAAVFAMEKLGMPVQPLEEGTVISPDTTASLRYAEARAEQARLEKALKRLR